MAYEQYANTSQSTLSGAILIGAPNLAVTDPTSFSPSGNFRLIIGTEELLVTSVAGAVFTVTRAVEGSTAAAHADLAPVIHNVTAGSLHALLAKGIAAGAFASRPAAALEGRIFMPSSGYVSARDNGSAWSPRAYSMPGGVEPDDSLFSWANQGGASVDTGRGGIFLSAPAVAGDNVRLRVMDVPSGAYTLTTAFVPYLPPIGFPACGLVLYDGTKMVIHNCAQNNGNYLASWTQKWNTVTGFNATYSMLMENLNSFRMGPVIWFQIVDDTVNRKTNISADGVHWYTNHTVSRTDFLTPTKIGFCANSNSTSYDVGIWLLSWTIT